LSDYEERVDIEKITEILSEFISRAAFETIPQEVIQIAKLHILDTLGVLIAGSGEQAAQVITGYIRSVGGEQQSTIMTQGVKTSAGYAALGNGVIGHVLDFDDYEVPSMAHPSVAVLPAVLALGERTKASGKVVLQSYLAGMEVISKLGAGINPDHYDKGWHSTGTLGPLGAAAGGSKILNLDPGKIRMALGIAASTSSGLRANFGSMTKCFHAGHAARNGVESAALASYGFTANREIFESDLGFCDLFTRDRNYDPLRIVDGLGAPFSLLSPGVGKKPYPSCAATHSYIAGILELVRNERIRPEEVASLKCGIFYRHPKQLIHSNPRTGLEGKFSLEFCLALALREGKVVLSQFNDSKVRDPEIQACIGKITKEVTEEAGCIGTPYPTAIMNLSVKGGKTYSLRIDKRKGSPNDPLTTQEVMEKFLDCAALRYPRDRAERILDAIMNLEKMEDVGKVIRLFIPMEVT
jgi:2-methylcitrate dehydratase PrpD